MEPPPQEKRQKKDDMVDSSLAENISVRRKVLTVKDMLKSLKSMQQSKTVNEKTTNNSLGWGGPDVNMSTNLHSGGKRSNIVDISENNLKGMVQTRISFEKIANMSFTSDKTIIQQKGKLKGKVQQQFGDKNLQYIRSLTVITSSFVLTENRVVTDISKSNPEEVPSQGSLYQRKTRFVDESLVKGSQTVFRSFDSQE